MDGKKLLKNILRTLMHVVGIYGFVIFHAWYFRKQQKGFLFQICFCFPGGFVYSKDLILFKCSMLSLVLLPQLVEILQYKYYREAVIMVKYFLSISYTLSNYTICFLIQSYILSLHF